MPIWDFDKLKDALDGDDGPKEVAGHSNGQDKKNAEWSDKIKDAFDGDDEERKRDEEAIRAEAERKKAEAKKRIEGGRGFTDKIQDAFDGGSHKHAELEAEYARIDAEADEKRTKLARRLSTRITGLFIKPKTGGGLTDQINELWGKQGKENAAKEEGFSDKLQDILHGDEAKQAKVKENKRGWFASKVNDMAGGGASGELDEDKLDKAVDFFQKHVLKAGDQGDESAIEQLKDEQISDGIRKAYKSVTGQEFPAKDK